MSSSYTKNGQSLSLYFFGVSLFVSAFLVFSIQPLISKMLLPLLGGSPIVWNASMLFFQALLLCGYAYAHFLSKIKHTKLQLFIHILLLLIFSIALPVTLPEGLIEPDPTHTDPLLWQLGTMLVVIGGPFFILSASAPILQHWFSKSSHPSAHNPYFLYGMSNIGSVLALLLYPTLIEPVIGIHGQTRAWSWAYGGLACIIFLCGLLIRQKSTPASSPIEAELKKDDDVPPSLKRKALWVLLAFCPSSLLLGTTNYITTDIAPVPLLWVIPLTLYILTFVIVFARKPLISYTKALNGQITIILIAFAMFFLKDSLPPLLNMLVQFGLLFFFVLVCHYELSRLKPSARYLTHFYFMMSLGGVLGGVFNNFIALHLFTQPLEYPLILVACLLCRGLSVSPLWKKEKGQNDLYIFIISFILIIGLLALVNLMPKAEGVKYILLFAGIATTILALHKKNTLIFISLYSCLLIFHFSFSQSKALGEDMRIAARERNFFGSIKVAQSDNFSLLLHGTTLHGGQSRDPELSKTPLFYYHPKTGIGTVFHYFDTLYEKNKKPQNIAVLGLGSGAVACFQSPHRHFTFYEIDPDMLKIARSPDLFSYLEQCADTAKIMIGDGRLQIKKEGNGSFDLIHLDAFSSDNIPMHLMTKEATQIYLDKLKEDGILMFHVSNRYLDLAPALSALGHDLGLYTLNMLYTPSAEEASDPKEPTTPTDVVIMTPSEVHRDAFINKGWALLPPSKHRVWTDNYSNILSAFRY